MDFKKSVAILFATLILFVAFSFWQSKPKLSGRDLIVGTVSGYAPFVSINELGEYEGFDIDLANAIANKVNKNLVLKDLGSMTSLMMALNQGSIDCAIWALSITPDRLSRVAMVKYQGEAVKSYPMLFWGQLPENVKSIFDMKGLTVCVEPNSSQEAILKKYDLIKIKPTEKVDDALLNIQYGKADAAFVETAIGNKFKNKYPQIKILNIELAPEEQEQGMGVAIKKENENLIAEITAAVDELKQSGVIKQLEDKWSIV